MIPRSMRTPTSAATMKANGMAIGSDQSNQAGAIVRKASCTTKVV